MMIKSPTTAENQGLCSNLEALIALERFVHHKPYLISGKKGQLGNHLSKWRGRGMDFAETRHYQAGDEIRHMEWKVTARTGRPHIKVFEEEKERPVFIIVDFNPSMYFGTRKSFKSVVAAKLAALIAWTTNRSGDRLGSLLFSADDFKVFMPKAGKHGVLPILEKLAKFTQQYAIQTEENAFPLSAILQRLRHITRPGSIIVLISDFYAFDRECERHLSLLREHHDILAYQIRDPLELAPPKPGIYPVRYGQESLFLDTRLASVVCTYQNWVENRERTLSHHFKKLKIPFYLVTAMDHLPSLVYKTFPRRKR